MMRLEIIELADTDKALQLSTCYFRVTEDCVEFLPLHEAKLHEGIVQEVNEQMNKCMHE